jgi:hypothetical protein
VSALVRPILDEKQKSGPRGQSLLSHLMYSLIERKGSVADEALVVLMCFDVGESQEELDAVIVRGKRMLPLLKKYRETNPNVQERSYPDSMLKGVTGKADAFDGAIKAIELGVHIKTRDIIP